MSAEMTFAEVEQLLATVRKDATDPVIVNLVDAVDWLLTYAAELETQIDETSAELKTLKRQGL